MWLQVRYIFNEKKKIFTKVKKKKILSQDTKKEDTKKFDKTGALDE